MAFSCSFLAVKPSIAAASGTFFKRCTAAISNTTRTPTRIRNSVGALRDVTRLIKSDWFALSAAKGTTQCIALYQAFSSREKAWLREARRLLLP